MALRIVGALLIVLACVLIALAAHLAHAAGEMASSPYAWSAPVSKELFLERNRLQDTYIVTCAAMAAAAGLGMLLRKWWPATLYGAVLSAGLLATFSWLTQLIAPPDFRFENPDPLGVLMGGSVALLAALAFAFRPKAGSMPNKRLERP
jgi:hypothetical protein